MKFFNIKLFLIYYTFIIAIISINNKLKVNRNADINKAKEILKKEIHDEKFIINLDKYEGLLKENLHDFSFGKIIYLYR